MVRRAIAGGAGLLVLILLVLGFKSCLGARKDRAIKDYVREVSSIVQESDQQSDQLFGLLSNRKGQGDVDVENTLNQFRSQAQQLTDRATQIDTPDEMAAAHRYLVETMELRQDGVTGIADQVPNALTQQERRQGTNAVASDMQDFLASDVVYTKRAVPSMRSALAKAGLASETQVPASQYLPSIDWLRPAFVAQSVSGIKGGGGQAATPGLHGTGVGTVSVGGTTLQPGASATIPAGTNPELDVQVANQGENTETNVSVKVSVGKGSGAITGDGTVDTIARGETKTVKIKLSGSPPTGQNVPINVTVGAVPGEKKTDNNKATYSAIFTR
jgi:hypothetical protein